ncbi:unnamed protein product, partial [Didymodactylos carnosus]
SSVQYGEEMASQKLVSVQRRESSVQYGEGIANQKLVSVKQKESSVQYGEEMASQKLVSVQRRGNSNQQEFRITRHLGARDIFAQPHLGEPYKLYISPTDETLEQG